jgi:hypothetical protein
LCGTESGPVALHAPTLTAYGIRVLLGQIGMAKKAS